MLKLIYAPFQRFQLVPIAAFLPAALIVAVAIGLGSPVRGSRARSAARGLSIASTAFWALYAISELMGA